jgi:hypothetical protein
VQAYGGRACFSGQLEGSHRLIKPHACGCAWLRAINAHRRQSLDGNPWLHSSRDQIKLGKLGLALHVGKCHIAMPNVFGAGCTDGYIKQVSATSFEALRCCACLCCQLMMATMAFHAAFLAESMIRQVLAMHAC